MGIDVGALLGASRNMEPNIRFSALKELGGNRIGSAAWRLGEALEHDVDPYIRWACAWGLSEIGPEARGQVWVLREKGLHDGDFAVRKSSAEALGNI